MAETKPISLVKINDQNILLSPYSLAKKEQDEEESSTDESVNNDPPAPVILDGKNLFEFKTNIEGLSNQERAEVAIERIKKIAGDRSINMDNITVKNIDNLYIIQVERNILVPLIKADAEANNKSLEQLSEEYAEIIKNAILEYREKRTLSYLGLRGLLSVLSTILVILIFRFLNWLVPLVSRRILEGRGFLFRTLSIQDWTLISVDQEKQCAILALKIIRWIIIFVVLYFYIPLVLSLFPQTERLGKSVFSSFFGA
ncbi:MAG: mechanosensitive ion channel family protein, partial [Crocosphaera sp.]